MSLILRESRVLSILTKRILIPRRLKLIFKEIGPFHKYILIISRQN